MTVQEFVSKYGIRMTAKPTDHNPYMADNKWTADHWKCVLRASGRQMTVIFSMGIGYHGRQPDVTDVLECIVSDAFGIRNAGSFSGWADDLGYDSDSIRALKTYNATRRQPDVTDVLECIVSDAFGIHNTGSFSEWADDLGYDSDSIRALKTYNATRRQTAKLENLIGTDFYDEELDF